jgi:hypothetical protein
MSFRFRIGPFTFGRSGIRLSIWNRGGGISIPLTGKKNRTFGKIVFGPFRWFFAESTTSLNSKKGKRVKFQNEQFNVDLFKNNVIRSFRADQKFIKNLRLNGLPWRAVQERLKEELPEDIINRDDIAYRLVPKVMNAIFGRQNIAWMTEKRPSKGGKGFTTWIIII